MSSMCLLETGKQRRVDGDLMSLTVTHSDLKNEADRKFFFENNYTSRADLIEKNSFVSLLYNCGLRSSGLSDFVMIFKTTIFTST